MKEKFRFLGMVENTFSKRRWLYIQGFYAPDLIEVDADDLSDDEIDRLANIIGWSRDSLLCKLAERGKRIGYITDCEISKSRYIQELDICYIPVGEYEDECEG